MFISGHDQGKERPKRREPMGTDYIGNAAKGVS
jgi:hypothetical protein